MDAPDDGELYALLNDGLALYADGQFFEAHEAWEFAWKVEVGRTKLALQALILVAAALHKHQLGVPAGTSKLLAKALEVIGQVLNGCSAWLGIDFVQLASELGPLLVEADRIARGEKGNIVAPALPRVSGPDGILYLHGFASGPSSAKARLFADAFGPSRIHLAIPDQNERDFFGFTISRALQLARRQLRNRTLLVGSSLGGYLGCLLAQSDNRIKGLVLMAPAFEFGTRLIARHGTAALEEWKRLGQAEVEHYGEKRRLPISYALVADAARHPGDPAFRVPTYILHGRRDETVPAELSERAHAAQPDLIELDLVDDDHTLVRSADRAIAAARRMVDRIGLRPQPDPVEPSAAASRLPS